MFTSFGGTFLSCQCNRKAAFPALGWTFISVKVRLSFSHVQWCVQICKHSIISPFVFMSVSHQVLMCSLHFMNSLICMHIFLLIYPDDFQCFIYILHSFFLAWKLPCQHTTWKWTKQLGILVLYSYMIKAVIIIKIFDKNIYFGQPFKIKWSNDFHNFLFNYKTLYFLFF